MPKRYGRSEELERERDARHARRQLDRLDQFLSLVRRAQRTAVDVGVPDVQLDETISAGGGLRARFAGRSGMVTSSRRRATPGESDSSQACFVFIDECGSHSLNAPDTFPVFALVAVIVPQSHYEKVLDLQWRAWKATHLGDQFALVHEPDVRQREKLFAGPAGDEVVGQLDAFLDSAQFDIVSCVMRRPQLRREAAEDRLDETLPDHLYLLATDFLFERIVLSLDRRSPGCKAEVIAESRGPKDDALLQYEFARLHLDGTSYIGPAFFRSRLHPGVSFRGKARNDSGLQLADLVARPIAEKVADPSSAPERWDRVRSKLCRGVETKNSILGLKVFPWDEVYEDLWKS